MSHSDNEHDTDCSGYLTPPLSPSKTVSTEGFFSPRTPCSPRKARSCHFPRGADIDAVPVYLTPPASPTKSKVNLYLDSIILPEGLCATHVPVELHLDDPPKKQRPCPTSRSSLPGSFTLAASHTPSKATDHLIGTANSAVQPRDGHFLQADADHPQNISKDANSSARTNPSQLPDDINEVSPNRDLVSTITRENKDSVIPPSPGFGRLPARSASSPLRPGQWVARGSFLSPRRDQARTPDRFIASRRPPAVTRESFEFNKTTERPDTDQIHRGGRGATDPFSRRLPRSGRLDSELRGLREAHSVLLGRIGSRRRNAHLILRRGGARQISAGAVWNVGGPSAVRDTVVGVSTGRGGIMGTGTNAPLYTSTFLKRADPEAELEAYERRLALAFDVEQTDRILQHSPPHVANSDAQRGDPGLHTTHTWRDCAWVKDGVVTFLDAPQLRDDYYCTLLAYSRTAKCLAVGLGNYVHLWSEASGVDTPESLNAVPSSAVVDARHVTSLDFSSTQGGQAILAVGRVDGRITLWSPFDSEPRFDATQPKPVSCVSWRPNVVQRPSLRDRAMDVPTEELLVGDEVGHIYFYSIEWPSESQSDLFGWHGAMTLLARMTIHTQQICGLAWASDGELFASGGNDNNCFLFETKKLLRESINNGNTSATLDVREGSNGESIYTVTNRSGPVVQLEHSAARLKWTLNAAVKAMAFCPWQRGLLAIGGGSNDRCIHFYHTRSGACLATIDCAAQVTSLVWSQTRREIAATFGFAQPEHPYRIAVFSWPSCEQIVAVPWWDENRALCAVAYPGGPTTSADTNDDDATGSRARGEDDVCPRRGVEDGCIVVAASDMAIRFHEIWSDKRGGAGTGGLVGSGTAGLLGGSDIIEGLHGIAREGAVIR